MPGTLCSRGSRPSPDFRAKKKQLSNFPLQVCRNQVVVVVDVVFMAAAKLIEYSNFIPNLTVERCLIHLLINDIEAIQFFR